MFNYTSIPNLSEMFGYFISYDFSKFLNMSIADLPTIGSVWFCSLIGVRIGVSFIRQALNI